MYKRYLGAISNRFNSRYRKQREEGGDDKQRTKPIGQLRTRSESWSDLPQSHRGISLRELIAFCDTNREWLEEGQFRCLSCHRCTPADDDLVGPKGPCMYCGHFEGVIQMRNLYEVNSVMIKPSCAEMQMSYVEMLALSREKKGGLEVDTFVSHWWGEEFPKFVRALEHYAVARCATQRCWKRTGCGFIFAGVFFPWLITLIVSHNMDISEFEPDNLITFLNICLVIPAVIMVNILLEVTPRDPLDFTFWVCAFCNNQYAVDHALGVDGDVSTSSFATALQAPSCTEVIAVLDDVGEIYRRIWCAFELFFVQVVMPSKLNKRIKIAIGNEHGVISDGDARSETITTVQEIIDFIRIEDAQASFPTDRTYIMQAIEDEGTDPEALDEILRNIASDGMDAVRLRQRAPFILFLLVPLVIFFFISILSDLDQYFEMQVSLEDIFTELVGFVVVTAVLSVATGCATGRGDNRRRRRFTMQAVSFGGLMVAPVLITGGLEFLVLFLKQNKDATYQQWEFYAAVYNIVRRTTTVVCAVGAIMGTFYAIVRNWPRFSYFRRFIEQTFLA